MKLKRYFKLWLAFFRYSLQGMLEFRGELVFWTFNIFLWFGLGMITLDLIFGKINAIAGWTKPEAYLAFFISVLFSDIFWAFFFPNLNNFSRLIRLGWLDHVLLKPVSPRFLISFKFIDFDHFLRMALAIFLIYRYTILVSGHLSLVNGLLFLLLFLCGIVIFYSFYFILTLTNIWFTNLSNLLGFFNDIKELGVRPVYIFKAGWFYLFSFIIPVAYIATFPAEALMGKISLIKIILAPALAVLFFVLSEKFFRFALKHYTSA